MILFSMGSYRDLFRVPQFGSLFLAASIQTAGGTVTGLALSTVVFSQTGSPLLSALALFGARFAQVLGATTLLSMADRVPPRETMVVLAIVFAIASVCLTISGMPVWVMLLIIFGVGVVNSVGAGVRWGLLSEIVPQDGYVLGRSVFSISTGLMEITGFALGGVMIAMISARHTLLLAAVLYLFSGLVARLGLVRRRPRVVGRPSIRETGRVNHQLLSHPLRRHVYLALWVPNGLVAGCTALFVPYAPESAGALFVAAAIGMLAGDTMVGRLLPPTWRPHLITPMRVLLAVPYLLFIFAVPLPVAVIAVACASIGYSAGLILQERLLTVVPANMHGQALGLHSSGMLTVQAICAIMAGAIAQHLSPATVMVVMALTSLIATIALTPRLHARGDARQEGRSRAVGRHRRRRSQILDLHADRSAQPRGQGPDSS